MHNSLCNQTMTRAIFQLPEVGKFVANHLIQLKDQLYNYFSSSSLFIKGEESLKKKEKLFG